ncbi:MAG: GNAT family N-acetyltransferase [Acidimicrobiales bacterium]
MHNDVIGPAQLTAQEVAKNAVRNHLTVAYADGVLVGNATVRAPHDGVVTVIVRILPAFRRRGFGSEYLRAMLMWARSSEVEQIRTVVPSENVDGLHFAIQHGFVETDRYEVDGVALVEFTLQEATT